LVTGSAPALPWFVNHETALVADLDADSVAVQLDADGQPAARLSRPAVQAGVGDQFGQARDGVVGAASSQDGGQEPACLPGLLGNGGKGARPRDQRGGSGLAHAFS
jgi:hypothetical protein